MIRKLLILMAIMILLPVVAEAGRWRGTISSSIAIQRTRGMTCVDGKCYKQIAPVTINKEITTTREILFPRVFRRFR